MLAAAALLLAGPARAEIDCWMVEQAYITGDQIPVADWRVARDGTSRMHRRSWQLGCSVKQLVSFAPRVFWRGLKETMSHLCNHGYTCCVCPPQFDGARRLFFCCQGEPE